MHRAWRTLPRRAAAGAAPMSPRPSPLPRPGHQAAPLSRLPPTGSACTAPLHPAGTPQQKRLKTELSNRCALSINMRTTPKVFFGTVTNQPRSEPVEIFPSPRFRRLQTRTLNAVFLQVAQLSNITVIFTTASRLDKAPPAERRAAQGGGRSRQPLPPRPAGLPRRNTPRPNSTTAAG